MKWDKEILNMEQPDYGNWVPLKYIYITGFIRVILLLSSFLFLLSIIGAIFFFICTVYLIYARNKFSPNGGNLQSKIYELVLDCLNWDGNGKLIDIGCGNAPLSIKAVKKYTKAHVTGIDYWGGMWEYSLKSM